MLATVALFGGLGLLTVGFIIAMAYLSPHPPAQWKNIVCKIGFVLAVLGFAIAMIASMGVLGPLPPCNGCIFY